MIGAVVPGGKKRWTADSDPVWCIISGQSPTSLSEDCPSSLYMKILSGMLPRKNILLF